MRTWYEIYTFKWPFYFNSLKDFGISKAVQPFCCLSSHGVPIEKLQMRWVAHVGCLDWDLILPLMRYGEIVLRSLEHHNTLHPSSLYISVFAFIRKPGSRGSDWPHPWRKWNSQDSTNSMWLEQIQWHCSIFIVKGKWLLPGVSGESQKIGHAFLLKALEVVGELWLEVSGCCVGIYLCSGSKGSS